MTQKKLKILYHHRTQGRGAEGVHISSIVRALEALGHEVIILSPPGVNPLKNAGNAPVDKSKVKTSGIDTLWKLISNYLPNFLFEVIEIFYNIPAMLQLEKELSAHKYDLIYERYAFYLIAGSLKAKKYNVPFVLEANEVNGIKERARKQSFPAICSLFEKVLFNRCSSIHTVSSYLKNMIINQGVAADKIEVVPNAVDLNKFSNIPDLTDLQNQYNLNGKFVIGFAGWFDNWDRLDLLLQCFTHLKSKYPELALLLVGDGDVLKTVRESVAQNNIKDVVLTGGVTRDKVQHYLSMLDLAVITHSNEFGSPVVMFEFMGLSIPIVAPKLMPITDVLIHDKTALLFDVLDMVQLEDQIERVIKDKNLGHQLADEAHSKLINDHTWGENAELIISVCAS